MERTKASGREVRGVRRQGAADKRSSSVAYARRDERKGIGAKGLAEGEGWKREGRLASTTADACVYVCACQLISSRRKT